MGHGNRTKRAVKKSALNSVIVCRCEEISEDEVRQAIKNGYHSPEELKRILRIGMGHCSGRGCMRVVARIIEEMAGIPIAKLQFPKSRPPVKPIKLQLLGQYRYESKDS